jgi:DNA-binding YbaB/EbfC family protein
MFDKIGQMMSVMKNLPKLQAAMAEMQQKLGQISVEGNAGAGMVVVKANGRTEITSCVISDEAYKLNDKDMLADLIIAATNMALAKSRDEAAKATQQMAADAGLSLPPGMLPGM